MSNGKGDKPRPLSIPQDDFLERWERTFKPWSKKLEDIAKQDSAIGEWARDVLKNTNEEAA